jgi:molybdenum cofactor guanylyltransferase
MGTPGPPGDAAEPFDAVILAGGRGRRLGGTDKPALVVGGRSMAASVLSAVADAEQVIVVGPERPGLRAVRSSGLRFVQEEPPGSGPIPALRRGIAGASAPWVAVLAADMPFLRATDLRKLRAAASGAEIRGAGIRGAGSGPGGAGTAVSQLPGAILVDDGGRPQWLAGCWRTAGLRSAIGAYRGWSLGGLLAPLRPAEVPPGPGPDGPPPWLDCDTAGDLDGARELSLRSGLR